MQLALVSAVVGVCAEDHPLMVCPSHDGVPKLINTELFAFTAPAVIRTGMRVCVGVR
jgi:hypothetical protein